MTEHSPENYSWQMSGVPDHAATMSLTEAIARLKVAVVNHRLTFLYLADIAGRVDLTAAAKTSAPWRQLDAAIANSGNNVEEALWEHRAALENAERIYYDKLDVPNKSGASTGTHTHQWEVESWAVEFLEDSSKAILRDCRIAQDALQRESSNLREEDIADVNRVLRSCADLTHDSGRAKWYGFDLIDWRYPSMLDNEAAELQRCLTWLPAFNCLGSQRIQETSRSQTNDGEFAFYRNGPGFDVRGFGESGHFNPTKGLDALYQLVSAPNRPISLAELGRLPPGQVEKLNCDGHSHQDTIDKRAIGEFKERLRELYEDRARAEKVNNSVGLEDANREIEMIEDELQNAVGLGGRSRDLNAKQIESMRTSMHGALKRAYKSLRTGGLPKLASHFEKSIRGESGTFVYNPEPTNTHWNTSKP